MSEREEFTKIWFSGAAGGGWLFKVPVVEKISETIVISKKRNLVIHILARIVRPYCGHIDNSFSSPSLMFQSCRSLLPCVT